MPRKPAIACAQPLRLAAVLAVLLLISGCGSSSTASGSSSVASGSSSVASGSSSGHGSVSVLYAGSLVNMMEHDLGPAFSRAGRYGYQGIGAGSSQLAEQIKGKVRRGDVFISASPKADAALQGPANGNHVSWYATFARAPLVIGYNPHSQFAAQFRTKPWFRVIRASGIRVGRTDPKLDPKGKLTVEAIDQAGARLHLPALPKALVRFDVFPEESLVGRLESGQLDAGFFYANEAKEQHIPTVPMTPVSKSATYTVTILNGAANRAAANAFVDFLLGRTGRATLVRHGLTVLARPTLTGWSSAVPPSLRSIAAGRG